MAEMNLVVARFLDGHMVKGSTEDFFPERPMFHVQSRSGGSQAIRMKDLKAVFFVRDLFGNSGHNKSREFPPAEVRDQGKKIAVLFKDGELLVGHTLTYLPGKQGFFVFPADRRGNNLRVYVLSNAARQVKVGPAAEQLVKITPRKPRPSASATGSGKGEPGAEPRRVA